MQHNGGVFLPPWGKVEQWLLSGSSTTRTMSTGSPATSPGWPRRWWLSRCRQGAPPVTGGAIRLHQLAKSFDGVAAVTGYQPSTSRPASSTRCWAPRVAARPPLRMIAGFEKPDAGRIGSTDVTSRPIPAQAPVNTVFQSYALFPFMTVWDNSGLRSEVPEGRQTGDRGGRCSPGDGADERSSPSAGPPRCRGPAAAGAGPGAGLEPRVLLLDDRSAPWTPNCDASQLELRAMQREVEITFVYVTHDQERR